MASFWACLCDVCGAAGQQAEALYMGARRASAKPHARDHVCRQEGARGRMQHRNLPQSSGSGLGAAFSGPNISLCRDTLCHNRPPGLLRRVTIHSGISLPVPLISPCRPYYGTLQHTGTAPRAERGKQRGRSTWPGAWPGMCRKLRTPLGGSQAGCCPVTLARASATSPDAPYSSRALR